jgi:hypothetical protein
MLGLMMIWVLFGDAVGVITENHFIWRKSYEIPGYIGEVDRPS